MKIGMNRATALAGILAFSAAASQALAGPDWIELGDAGSLITSAQIPTRFPGAFGLSSISGSLSSSFTEPDYEDLYFIRITNPTAWSVRIASAEFNPVMYLFNVTVPGEGYGLLGNDDESPTSNLPKLTNMSDDGTEVVVAYPGDYVLAVTTFGRYPVSRRGPIFNLASNTEISGPDGPGAINPLLGWEGSGQTGRYSFTLEATDFPAVPAPGVALVGLAGAGIITSRRRRA